MVHDLWDRGYNNIHILDNTSSYDPLLQWYEEVKHRIQIHHLPSNMIQNAIFDYENGAFLQQFQGKIDWIAYTDSDLTFNSKMPHNFVADLIEKANRWGSQKAGLALQIDDLPDSHWGRKNREWEERFWLYPLEDDVYAAQLDTTFSIWNPCTHITFDAIRLAGNYTARHEPWYSDFKHLTDEEYHFLKNAHCYSTYRRYYEEHYLK